MMLLVMFGIRRTCLQRLTYRCVSTIIILLVLGAIYQGGAVVVEAQQGNYFPPGPIEEGWPENALLIYSGFYELGRSGLSRLGGLEQDGVQRSDDGDWLHRDFIPYVAHLNGQGEPHDTFFDSFVFLGLSSHRARNYAGELGQEKAALWYDWQWYIDRIFTPDKQLGALNRTVGEIGETLGQPHYKANVYLMIPYPSYKVSDFGFPDGQMGGESLLPVENRQRAIRWYVDEVLERWEAWQPDHLRLAGFYWLQEHINPAVPQEEQMVRDAVKYVQERGYKMGWIPWSGAYLATQWASYGFDWAIIQPNHMFRDRPNDLQVAAERGANYRMGIEIELDGRVKQPAGEKKLYDYLDAGIEYGYMHNAMIGYYQDAHMLAQLYYDENGRWRHMYDAVYAFAKRTYPNPTPAALQVRGVVVDTDGDPVVGAIVHSGRLTTRTLADGTFTLNGFYTNRADLTIMKRGYDPVVTSVVAEPNVNDATVHRFTLADEFGRIVHAFDTVQGLGRIGVTLTHVTEPKLEGDGALKVTLLPGGVHSFWITPGEERNWSDHTALALDVLVPMNEEVRLQISLRDHAGKVYTRSYETSPGEWHMIMLPLGDAMTGRYNEPVVLETDGKIDLTNVFRVTIAVLAQSSPEVVFDNLRLLGSAQ